MSRSFVSWSYLVRMPHSLLSRGRRVSIKPSAVHIIGPAGSGKTRILMGLAHKITQEQRQLLYWVGLPHQRERTISRLAKVGTLLGNQFVTLQQLYYHLLEDHP